MKCKKICLKVVCVKCNNLYALVIAYSYQKKESNNRGAKKEKNIES